MNISKITNFHLFNNFKFIFGIYLIITIFVAFHQYFLGTINNYLLFKYSFEHLTSFKNLCEFYPEKYYDNYKYGPIFALIIAPISFLPNWLGALTWALLNLGVFWVAIYYFNIPKASKVFLLWFVLHEYLTSTQNLQINPLMTGLFIIIFILLEKGKSFWAALPISLTMLIKIFGIVFLSFFFIYRSKTSFLIGIIFWTLVLFYLPAIFSSIDFLYQSYNDWYVALVFKAGNHFDISILRFLNATFLPNVNKYYILLGGIVLFCLSYLRYESFQHPIFKQLFLASIMIWTVIFSPSAESPTYIIAVTGVAIWYINSEKNNWQKALMLLAFILTIMSPSDLFPVLIRKTYIVPYALKSLPCGIVWLITIYEMLFRNFNKVENPKSEVLDKSII